MQETFQGSSEQKKDLGANDHSPQRKTLPITSFFFHLERSVKFLMRSGHFFCNNRTLFRTMTSWRKIGKSEIVEDSEQQLRHNYNFSSNPSGRRFWLLVWLESNP
jgi:hypothetical protein